MSSRTPIRLTPHRGPLATPSTSLESSPTSSTPPTDISSCSSAVAPSLDVAILERRISALSPPTKHQSRSRLSRRRGGVIKSGLLGRSAHLCRLDPILEDLIYSAYDLATALAGIVTFCLLLWGLLEWSSYASELPRQPNHWMSIRRFPLPSPSRALRCNGNPLSYEAQDQHVAVLQFLYEHIVHAKAMSSLSIGLGLPLRAFFETHRSTIQRVIGQHNLPDLPHLAHEVDTWVNMTEFLDPSVLDFTPSSFIGRSFTLALDELGDLISEPIVSHGFSAHGEHQDAHLLAIHWRTTSNLLLEYSAARPRARRLSQRLHSLHQQLSPLVSCRHAAGSVKKRLDIWWWKGIPRPPVSPNQDGVQTFVTGLEITIDNVRQLIAYLDWITEHLAQMTLKDVLKIRHQTDFSSCMALLQELFAHSRPWTSKKSSLCPSDHGFIPYIRPERVGIMVPGSPTVRAGR